MGGVEYQVTKVDPTDPHTKGAVYQVHKVSEEVAATLGGKVYRARIISDPTAPTVVGKVYQIVLIEDPEDPAVKGKVYNAILTGDGPEVVVVGPAVSPLSLPDAAAGSLQYVKVFGGTKQPGIPASYSQQRFIYMPANSYLLTDIYPTYDCKVEMDFQTSTVPSDDTVKLLGGKFELYGGLELALVGSAFTVNAFGEMRSDKYFSDITAQNNTRYKFTFNNKVATLESGGTTLFTNTFSDENEYDNGADLCINGLNYEGESTASGVGIYLYSFKVWNADGELVANYIPATQKYSTWVVVGFYDTVSGTFKTATAGTFEAGGDAVPTPDAPMDIVSNNGVLKGGNEFNANAVTNGYFYNNELDWVANPDVYTTDYMKTEKGKYILRLGKMTTITDTVNVCLNLFSDNKEIQSQVVIPMTADTTEYTHEIDIPDGISYVRISTNPSMIRVVYFHRPNFVYADGTVEGIKDSLNNYPRAEMLLKVGNYEDVQEILSGTITRNVGVKVFNGSEQWTRLSGYLCISKENLGSDSTVMPYHSANIICSHFENKTDTYTDGMSIGNSYVNFKYDSSITTLSDWKQWLAAQYNAGTPVIIVYPLATPTTESVAGQTLQVKAGDNTLEITQASLSGLKLEAGYQKEAN